MPRRTDVGRFVHRHEEMTGIRPWTKGKLKGEVLAGCEALDPASLPWEEARFKKPLPEGFRLAKRSRSRWVIATEVKEETFYFKRETYENWQRRISAALLGPKTLREWNVGHTFLEHGLLVPEPVLWARDATQSFLVTRSVPSSWQTAKAWIRDESFETRRRHIAQIASYAAALHTLPVYHHDFRNNHIYQIDTSESEPVLKRFGMIDLDGAFVGKPVRESLAREACVEFFRSFTKGSMQLEDVQAYTSAYREAGGCTLDAGEISDYVKRNP